MIDFDQVTTPASVMHLPTIVVLTREAHDALNPKTDFFFLRGFPGW